MARTPPPLPPSQPNSTSRRVTYFYEPDIGAFSYPFSHPMKPTRMRISHSLIQAYGLLPHMNVRRPKRATPVDMTKFHTDEYIDFLMKVTPQTVFAMTEGVRFITGDDSPAWDGLFDFASVSAGGSISAAHALLDGSTDIAINWAGGLHHAKRAEASGFCYVNDIVLGILELLRSHARVLYVDIDIHHGDGVEEAFYTTDRVMTCSFHKHGEYFPGTGTLDDTGKGRGKGYCVNVPLKEGIADDTFGDLFRSVVGAIMEWYRPGAVVLQGGADSLAGDKLGVFNLSMQAHASCIAYLRTFNVPLLCVGGGGYTVKNVARTWCYETAVALGLSHTLSPNLPYTEYFDWFGPRYRLEVLKNNMPDLNVPEYLEGLKQSIFESMRGLPFAPGVQGQEVPRGCLGGWGTPGEEWESDDSSDEEMDMRISQRVRDAHTRHTVDPLSDAESAPSEDDAPAAAHTYSFRTRKRPRHSPSPPPGPIVPEIVVEEENEEKARMWGPMKKKRVFFEAPPPVSVRVDSEVWKNEVEVGSEVGSEDEEEREEDEDEDEEGEVEEGDEEGEDMDVESGDEGDEEEDGEGEEEGEEEGDVDGEVDGELDEEEDMDIEDDVDIEAKEEFPSVNGVVHAKKESLHEELDVGSVNGADDTATQFVSDLQASLRRAVEAEVQNVNGDENGNEESSVEEGQILEVEDDPPVVAALAAAENIREDAMDGIVPPVVAAEVDGAVGVGEPSAELPPVPAV